MTKGLFRLSAAMMLVGFGLAPSAAFADEVHLSDGRCATVDCTGAYGCVIIEIHNCPNEMGGD